jgi:hypothetical protein
MIVRTRIKCRSCRMPVVLPLRTDLPSLPSPPFCGCRFYRKQVRNAIIEVSPQMRIRIERPLWLVQHDHGSGFALLGEGLEVLVESGKVWLNGESIRGAKLILPPT